MSAPIHVKIDPKALQRYSDFVFEPGPVEIVADGHEVIDWIEVTVDRAADPGLTVGQAETLKDLIAYGVTLALREDGKLSVVKQ